MLNLRRAIALIFTIVMALSTASCITVNVPGASPDKNTQQGNQDSTSTGVNRGIPSFPPTVESFSASPASLTKGSTGTLNWDVKNANSIVITPDIGAVAASGAKKVKPDSTTTYTIVASNARGMISQSATVSVLTPGKMGVDFDLVTVKKPDLVVTELYVKQDGTIGCTVANIGTEFSKATWVSLDFSGAQVEDHDIPAIEPGKDIRFIYTTGVAKNKGTTIVTATIDRIKSVDELNEGNNSATITYTP